VAGQIIYYEIITNKEGIKIAFKKFTTSDRDLAVATPTQPGQISNPARSRALTESAKPPVMPTVMVRKVIHAVDMDVRKPGRIRTPAGITVVAWVAGAASSTPFRISPRTSVLRDCLETQESASFLKKRSKKL
jgi:hypothetical protein